MFPLRQFCVVIMTLRYTFSIKMYVVVIHLISFSQAEPSDPFVSKRLPNYCISLFGPAQTKSLYIIIFNYILYCQTGTYQTRSRLGKCDDCVEGAYCNETGLSYAKNCPAGSYCPERTIIPKDCPEGTFNPGLSGKTIGACQNCTAGEYCASVGLSSTSGSCYAGFYCILGSPMPNPPVSLAVLYHSPQFSLLILLMKVCVFDSLPGG